MRPYAEAYDCVYDGESGIKTHVGLVNGGGLIKCLTNSARRLDYSGWVPLRALSQS